jgi:hypothetical protein
MTGRIEDAWDDFEAEVLGTLSLGPSAHAMIKAAFFGGAASVLVELKRDDVDRGVVFDELSTEMDRYAVASRARRRRQA